jgi:triosephosphate isomerase
VTSPTRVIAGNWKLHNGPSATARFFAELLQKLPNSIAGTVAFFPPSVSLAAAREALRDRPEIRLGVQNVYWEESGAFTGEISPQLAADAGASMALVGHSERRHLFGETDAEAARKAHAVIAAGLSAIFCVGETLAERDAGRAFEVVERQLNAVPTNSGLADATLFLVAYEPVWAIGTGRTATPADASEMHGRLRQMLREKFSSAGDNVPVLYGGSVKPENAESLLAARDVDGLLVGGASLDPAGFARICSLIA